MGCVKDPTNVTSLADYAKFLHTKRGELVRAEAFFNRYTEPFIYYMLHTVHTYTDCFFFFVSSCIICRGLQFCLPDLDLKCSPSSKKKSVSLIADKSSSPVVDDNGLPIHTYIHTYIHTHIHILKYIYRSEYYLPIHPTRKIYLFTNNSQYPDRHTYKLYIHTFIVYIHSFIHTYIHTYTHTYIHTLIHTYVHTHIHTYIRTYTHIYIHTYIHT